MLKFKEWFNDNYPDSIEEGFLQRIHPTANRVVGAANAAISGMGVLGRLYTPFLGLGGPHLPDSTPQHINPPAMVARQEAEPDFKGMFSRIAGRKIANLTKNKHIDLLGSIVGEPTSQKDWDAADWIPAVDLQRHKDDDEEDAHAGRGQIAIARGSDDPSHEKRRLRR